MCVTVPDGKWKCCTITCWICFETTEVRPGDVAVVTPDPDAYRPFVEEVFPASRQPMALHVAGARRGVGEAGTDVMLRSLNLVGTRYKVPDVLDWLETGPVLGDLTDRTGLRHTLHNWVMRQRIRWGIDPGQLQRAGFPLSGRHTWQHGIDRLLLSWLAAEGEDVVVGDLLTGSTVAGQETGALLGRLATVINALASLQHHSETPHTIPRWCDILSDFATQIFTESEDGRQYAGPFSCRTAIAAGTGRTTQPDSPGQFSRYFRSYLSGILDTTGLGRAWNPGTITFTGMVALHQLPFRVVAILGLNDGKLPGKNTGFCLRSHPAVAPTGRPVPTGCRPPAVSGLPAHPGHPIASELHRNAPERQQRTGTLSHAHYAGRPSCRAVSPGTNLVYHQAENGSCPAAFQPEGIFRLNRPRPDSPTPENIVTSPLSRGRSRRARKPLFETWRSDITSARRNLP